MAVNAKRAILFTAGLPEIDFKLDMQAEDFSCPWPWCVHQRWLAR